MDWNARRRLLLLTPLLLLAIWQGLPVLLLLITSLRSEASLLRHGPWAWDELFLEHYQRVLITDGFAQPLVNSLIVALTSTVLATTLGMLAAMAFARLRFSGSRFLAFSVFLSRVIPPVAMAIPVFILLKGVGLTDSLLGLILAHSSFSLPMAIWLMLPFFQSLPRELEEAAYLDGLSKLRTMYSIMLPLALPGVAVAASFCFLASWNDFLFSMLLSGAKTKTAPLAVNAYMTGFGPEWGPMTASALIILVPILLLSGYLRRHMVAGMLAGGVKDA